MSLRRRESVSTTLETMEQEALSALANASSAAALEEWHQEYLGRRGKVTVFMRSIGSLPAEERPQAGQAANVLRQALQAQYQVREAELQEAELTQALAAETVDVTMPGRRPWTGGLHPITLTLRRIYTIFAEMGFQVYRSREVESDLYNFELLNMPPQHPARDMWDTFYVTDHVVLRTHTSPGQCRAMRSSARTQCA